MTKRIVTGRVFDIQRFSIHDGPGIRTTVFLKGCPLDCWWCHNPEGRHPRPESMAAGSNRDAPGDTVPVGTRMSVDAIMAEIEKDRLFYDESGGGVTFSGGEPLAQPDFLAALLNGCREQGIHTALDTTGYAPPEIIGRIAPLVDLFLYDLKHMKSDQHKSVTGVPNEVILENAKKIAEAGGKLQVRIPVIPRFNDSEENIKETGEFCKSLGDAVTIIQLLPYHNMGVMKYQRISNDHKVLEAPVPTEDKIQSLKKILEDLGLSVTVH